MDGNCMNPSNSGNVLRPSNMYSFHSNNPIVHNPGLRQAHMNHFYPPTVFLGLIRNPQDFSQRPVLYTYHQMTHQMAYPMGHQMAYPMAHQMAYPMGHPMAHQMAYPMGHQMAYPMGHQMAYPMGHQMAYPMGHQMAYPMGHQMAYPMGHQMAYPMGHQMAYPMGHQIINQTVRPTSKSDNIEQSINDAMEQGKSPIIIDNISNEILEMKLFVDSGVKFGYIIEVLELETRWARKVQILYKKDSHNVCASLLANIKHMLENPEHNATGSSLLLNYFLQYDPTVTPLNLCPRSRLNGRSPEELGSTYNWPEYAAYENIENVIEMDDNTIDFHRLRVREAIEILDLFLDVHIKILKQLQTGSIVRYRHLVFITGRGVHSQGAPKIKPAVIKRLFERDLSFIIHNPGLLISSVRSDNKLTCEISSAGQDGPPQDP
ncbi:uncharacterized protein LOC116769804 [Danaus plexippus]|uniref:uncharacterized protein LOC116769804 n=1 Tax=Danaus plexippus TaxID=13037 RepID=UPI002AB11F89|nr:uncharacterized protein LOC116769804 [Danaus plexippus]